MELHQRVPADRWCVSRRDLVDFRRRVRQAIDDGTLTPTERDSFDASDDVIGPGIHTVVQQLIKPVTHAAGDMSWALMQNEEGVVCDLFVTHCWQEGVFEFVDKVLHSWPLGARGAYCCMLSNPQNLDIGALISSPRDSPFAQALTAAKFMMVVPNSRVSIYSRIWCAYEAFLGYEQSKTIFAASPPRHRVWVGFLKIVAAWLAFSLVLLAPFAFLTGPTDEDFDWDTATIYEVMGLPAAMKGVMILCALLGIICCFRGQACAPFSYTQRAYELAGVAFEALITAVCCHAVYFSIVDEAAFDTRFRAAHFRTEMLGMAGGTCLIVAAMAAIEIDNQLHLLRMKEHSELLNGYSGRLRDAQASVQRDRDHIFGELESSGNEAAADSAVHVLIENGMSTSRLRRTVEIVGELQHAGYWNLSYVAVGMSVWLFMPAWRLTSKFSLYLTWAMHRHGATETEAGTCQCSIRGAACLADGGCVLDRDTCSAPVGSNCAPPWESPFQWLNAISLMMAVLWVAVLICSHPDIRRFLAISMTRLLLIQYLICFIHDYARGTSSLTETDTAVAIRFCTVCLVYAVMLAGPVRLARLPGAGPLLVRFFFANVRQRQTKKPQETPQETPKETPQEEGGDTHADVVFV